MKHLALFILSLPLFAAPVAELVNRMPEFGANARFEGPAWDAAKPIFDEILAGGDAAVTAVVDLLREPGGTPNFKPRYVMHGLAQYLAASDKTEERTVFLTALGNAVDNEKRPIAVRGFLIRQMQVCGGSKVIPHLASSLRSPQLRDYAVQALVAIGDPDGANVLLAALEHVQGNNRRTILQGLGALHCKDAVPTLIAALKGDRDIRVTAARALAQIGDPRAIDPLLASIPGKPTFDRGQLAAATLALAANSADADAKRIYTSLSAPSIDAHVRIAALQGLGPERILEAASADDPRWRHVSVNAAASASAGSEVEWLERMPSETRSAFVDAVCRARPGELADLIAAAAVHEQEDVRWAVSRHADGKTILALLEDQSSRVRDAAQAAARLTKDAGFDEQLAAVVAKSRDPRAGIEILANRRAKSALPTLIGLTETAHADHAISAIAAIGDRTQLPLLLEMLKQGRRSAESALVLLGRRMVDKDAFSNALIAARNDANSVKLLKILGQVPSATSLAYLRDMLKTEQAMDALRALEKWPTPEPAADLLAFAKSATDTKANVMAMRGYLNMMRMSKALSREEQLAQCVAGLGAAQSVETKRAIIGLLASIHSVGALAAARPFIDEPKLAADAGNTVIDIARRLGKEHKEAVREAVSEALIVASDRQRKEGEKLLEKVGGEQEPPASKVYLGRQTAQTMHWLGADWLLRAVREREEATSVMIHALELKPGQVVADLGCGNGYHSLMMARLVGESGKIYGVDIQKEMLTMLKKRAKDANIANVVPVLGKFWDPNLPANSIDVALIVDAYHEFSHPARMLKGIYKALKPKGVVVFLEYRMEDPEVPIKRLHKMSKVQVDKELTANGFKLVKSFDKLPWQHMLWYGKE
jgi:HEAT repeat protein/protein-L-isoaspartate O-methyltransferase